MSFIDILTGINYGLAFFFGSYLMLVIVGASEVGRRQIIPLAVYWPASLALQTISWLIWGLQTTKQIYPLIVHLPLLLIFIFGLKKSAAVSLVSICTGYLCCQLPRFGEIIVTAATGSELAGQITYLVIIVPIFFFLNRYFVPSAREAMLQSPRSLFLFGCLPIMYVIFDYATTIYSDVLYSGSRVAAQTLPTVVGLLYMAYTTAYRQQLQRQTQTELLNSIMAVQLKQAEADMTSLRQADAQSAIYRHDMRHHLAAIDSFLTAGKPEQARKYIKSVQNNIESVTPRRFCKNELVNLICSSFVDQGEQAGVPLSVRAELPALLTIPDAELCALLSNALENAISAAGTMEKDQRWVSCTCVLRAGKLLIEVKNPYQGTVAMRDGLPISNRKDHGYGCRSIQTITEQNHGLCEFKAERGIFTLRMVLPVRSG